MSLHAVLFDLDGTLLDTAPDMGGALNELRAEHDLARWPPPRSVIGCRTGPRRWCGSASARPTPERFEALRLRFLEIYASRLAHETTLFEGGAALLDALDAEDIPWGIVTNKPGWLTDPLLEALALRARARVVVSGDTLPEKKPHPQPLLLAAGRLGRRPGACAYVGDAERDMLAARAAGMHGVLATFGYLDPAPPWNEWPCVATITRLGELLPWLRLNGLDGQRPVAGRRRDPPRHEPRQPRPSGLRRRSRRAPRDTSPGCTRPPTVRCRPRRAADARGGDRRESRARISTTPWRTPGWAGGRKKTGELARGRPRHPLGRQLADAFAVGRAVAARPARPGGSGAARPRLRRHSNPNRSWPTTSPAGARACSATCCCSAARIHRRARRRRAIRHDRRQCDPRHRAGLAPRERRAPRPRARRAVAEARRHPAASPGMAGAALAAAPARQLHGAAAVPAPGTRQRRRGALPASSRGALRAALVWCTLAARLADRCAAALPLQYDAGRFEAPGAAWIAWRAALAASRGRLPGALQENR